jgi:hypothetical protein
MRRRGTTCAAAALATVGITLLLAGAALAVAVAPGVYDGTTPKAKRYMDIAIQVRRGGSWANWRIDVFGPCRGSDDQLDRTVGTDSGGGDKQLKIRAGHFKLDRRAYVKIDGLRYQYQLTGHATDDGFAGTFHYRENEFGVTCDSTTLHWSAKRTGATFP